MTLDKVFFHHVSTRFFLLTTYLQIDNKTSNKPDAGLFQKEFSESETSAFECKRIFVVVVFFLIILRFFIFLPSQY